MPDNNTDQEFFFVLGQTLSNLVWFFLGQIQITFGNRKNKGCNSGGRNPRVAPITSVITIGLVIKTAIMALRKYKPPPIGNHQSIESTRQNASTNRSVTHTHYWRTMGVRKTLRMPPDYFSL